jgi:hypothetical protein
MQYIGEHGIVRPRDIEAIGLPREYLISSPPARQAQSAYTWNLHTSRRRRDGTPLVRKSHQTSPASHCLPAFSSRLSRDHDSDSCIGLDRSLQRGKDACSRFAFTQDRSAVRTITDGGNRKTSGGGRPSPRLFSRQDRRRLFQISKQNRTRRRNRGPKGLSSPEKGRHKRNLPLRQSMPG